MFLNVFTQVVILFVLIMLGVILAKTGKLNEQSAKQMTDIVLLFVTPCVIIKSFMRPFDPTLTKDLLTSLLIAIAVHIGYILLSLVLVKDKNKAKQKVLQFGVIFSNCGFMAVPLLEALLGDIGVFYGASFIAIFNVLVWTYGICIMSGEKSSFTVKKLLLNPGIIGMAIALIVFFLNIPIYKAPIIAKPIEFMAALNTPLPMIIIGYHLANSNILEGLKSFKTIYAIFLKLFAFPLLALLGMYLCGIKGDVLVACTVCAAAPTAAITTMFSAKYGGDTPLSVSTVSLSTVFSIISMPIIITLAQIIA